MKISTATVAVAAAFAVTGLVAAPVAAYAAGVATTNLVHSSTIQPGSGMPYDVFKVLPDSGMPYDSIGLPHVHVQAGQVVRAGASDGGGALLRARRQRPRAAPGRGPVARGRDDVFGRFGILRDDYSRKPAFAALRDLIGRRVR